MTVFDFVLAGLIIVSVFFAAYRGAIREFITLAALGLAALIAFMTVGPILSAIGMEGSFFGLIFASAGVGFVSFVALYIIGAKLAARLKLDDRQTLADRIGGGVFGFVRALALIGLGFLGYGFYLDEGDRPQAVNGALLLPLAKASAAMIEAFAPHKSDASTVPIDGAIDGSINGAGSHEAGRDEDALGPGGYESRNRAGLEELVTTVTTTDGRVADHAATQNAPPIEDGDASDPTAEQN